MSPIYSLKNKRSTLLLDVPKVMGILNVTPDSFSDGGYYQTLDKALFHVEKMIAEGATLIDIGGESTRPGAKEVSINEELDRTQPIIEAIRRRFDVWLSIDTSKPEVMLASAESGIDLINDVRALQLPGAREAASQTGLPVCLMHRQGEPQTMQLNPSYNNVTEEVVEFLKDEISQATMTGILSENILVDPGFGFGKNPEHNYKLLGELDKVHELGYPLLIGLSRKRMIHYALSTYTHSSFDESKLIGSVSGALICAMKGAHILRVHDVKETVEALSIFIAMQEFI